MDITSLIEHCQTLHINISSKGTPGSSPKWCVCPGEETLPIVGCDSENCKIQWFHFGCMEIKKTPKGKWFCPECRSGKTKRFNRCPALITILTAGLRRHSGDM
uniref:PHD-type domain-containing protein n=1 Tax=Salarias fasciatus TaxID=181472 RepID=A0A672J7U1_SALFA